LSGFVMMAACLGFTGTAFGEDENVPAKTSTQFLAAFREVIVPASRSTVRIQCGGKDSALGTVVGAEGWVLTKASELKSSPVCKLRDGRELPALVVGVHEPTDLALLKIEAKGLTPVEWRSSKEVAVGNWLASPGLSDSPLAVGVASVATRAITGRELSPPSPDSGFLGVTIEPGKNGVKITSITPGSAASKAGLKVDDVILAVSGKTTEDPDALLSRLSRTKPGDVVTLRVRRDEEELEMKATLEKRPMDQRQGRGEFQNRLGSELSQRRTGFPNILQHDTVLRPADCGGPLVDLDGKVVGINIARAGRTESYAIPTEIVATLLPELKTGKLAPALNKVAELKAALQKVQAEKVAAEKKITELKEALDKARAAFDAAEKKSADLKEQLQKAEAEAKAAQQASSKDRE
jgi:serine protease Do